LEKLKVRLRTWVFGWIILGLYFLISKTWKIKLILPAGFDDLLEKKQTPLVFAHWHGDELVLLSLTKRFRIATLTSTSDDGQLIDFVLKKMGAKTAKGSSTRGAISGLKSLIRIVLSGRNVSFAVDGPKGPIYEVKPGVFEVYKILKNKSESTKLFAAGIACDRSWKFKKSWNQTYFPKPFSNVVIYWSELNSELDLKDPSSWQNKVGLKSYLHIAKENALNELRVISTE
jgi:lysophospholipid acyltransferase (LPLAT)-like uncharacterized protein